MHQTFSYALFIDLKKIKCPHGVKTLNQKWMMPILKVKKWL